MSGRIIVLPVMVVVLASTPLQADKAEGPDDQPATHTLGTTSVKMIAELEGVVVAETMHEVRVEPKSWQEFVVSEAVSHGQQIREGDVLIRFDSQKLEEAIADLEAEEQLADLAIEMAEQDFPQYERSLQLDLEAAERSMRVAKEDADRFSQLERPVAEERAEWIMKSARFWYEYYLEELRQLEKMYEADDLTEETEEVILTRQRYWVEQGKFQLKTAELERDRMARLTIPRQQETYEHAREMSKLALAKAKHALALGLNEKRFTLEKNRYARSRAREKLARLNEDKRLMILRAPASGTVYYGRCVHGKWSEIDEAAKKLLPGGTVAPRQVVMCVVDTEDVDVRAEVPAKHLSDLRVGMDVPVSVPALGADEMDGRLVELSSTPVASGKFSAKVVLQGEPASRTPVPGMRCKLKPVVYTKQDALVAPAAAVVKDLWTGEHYVMLVEGDGPPRKHPVVVGRQTEEQIEIVEGVSPSDRILEDAKEGTES